MNKKKETLGVMEAVYICKDIYHNKKTNLSERDYEAINFVSDYVESDYISHVEDIGYAIPQIVEQAEEHYRDKALKAMCLATCKGYQDTHRCFVDDCDIKRKFLEELEKI